MLWNRDPKDFACGDPEALRSWWRSNRLAGGDVVELEMSVGDGMKMILSGGAVLPPWSAGESKK